MTPSAETALDLPTEADAIGSAPVPVCTVEDVLDALSKAPKVPTSLRTKSVREQFLHAFDLIGGVPRLAMWGHQNPDKFFPLYSKLIPAQVTGENGGPIRIELPWINGRDTSGRPRQMAEVIDINPIREA